MIKRVTLKKQAYDYLLNIITTEKIKPLEVYSEQYFADMLEISRTPIREAVLQLSQEGFLQIHPNKGFSVKLTSDRDVEEIFALRCAIEGYCAMYAAEQSKTTEGKRFLNRLEHLLSVEKEDYKKNVSHDVWMENDTVFHKAILEFSNNSIFIETMENLRAKIKLIGMRSLYTQGRTESTVEEHEIILKAIASGDRLLAYSSMQEHFEMCREVILNDRQKGRL